MITALLLLILLVLLFGACGVIRAGQIVLAVAALAVLISFILILGVLV